MSITLSSSKKSKAVGSIETYDPIWSEIRAEADRAIKDERYERLMEHQRGISLAKNRAMVGAELDVLIEGTGLSLIHI